MKDKWKDDFRYDAIQASTRRASDRLFADRFELPFSFCLPVAEQPVSRWITPARVILVFLILGFAGILGGGVIVFAFERSNFWLSIAVCSSLCGFAAFAIGTVIQGPITSWCIGPRGKELRRRGATNRVTYCELGDSANPTMSVDGDDHVLFLIDETQRRLMIEGVGATYQIYARDIISIAKFEFMTYLGADIVYRIDDETSLRIGLAKASQAQEMRNQLGMPGQSKNKILSDICDALEVSCSPDEIQPFNVKQPQRRQW